jgi:hypothetical protein
MLINQTSQIVFLESWPSLMKLFKWAVRRSRTACLVLFYARHEHIKQSKQMERTVNFICRDGKANNFEVQRPVLILTYKKRIQLKILLTQIRPALSLTSDPPVIRF